MDFNSEFNIHHKEEEKKEEVQNIIIQDSNQKVSTVKS